MLEGVPRQFSTPEQEIEFLRNRIAMREREMFSRTPEVDHVDVETVSRQEIKHYTSFTPKMVLDKEYALSEEAVKQSAEAISASHDPVQDILQIAYEKGIRNALSVLEQTNNTYVIDEVHRQLIEQIRSGAKIGDLKEGLPPWHILHMTLYEVTLPSQKNPEEGTQQVVQLMGMMEQLLAGLRTIGSAQSGNHFVIAMTSCITWRYQMNSQPSLKNKLFHCFPRRSLSCSRMTTIFLLTAVRHWYLNLVSRNIRFIQSSHQTSLRPIRLL
jgi:hypothetical protein